MQILLDEIFSGHSYVCSMPEFLDSLGINENQHIYLLSRSIKHLTVFIKQEPKDVSAIAYHPLVLSLSCSNTDLRYVLDPNACMQHISKSHISTISKLLLEASQQLSGQLFYKAKIKTIGKYISEFKRGVCTRGHLPTYWDASRSSVFIILPPPPQSI
jgi:hypothetical protein